MLGWVVKAAGSCLETLGHLVEPQDLVKMLKCMQDRVPTNLVGDGSVVEGHIASGSQATRKLLGQLGILYLWVTYTDSQMPGCQGPSPSAGLDALLFMGPR